MGELIVLAEAFSAMHALAASPGEVNFESQYADCYQPDGGGAAELGPPLSDHLARYLATEDVRSYLAQILISGMAGPITVDGPSFSGLMPFFARRDDADLAETITYVVVSMNHAGRTITRRAIAAARAAQPTPVETRKIRQKTVSAGN
jgi:hypothetical protein